MPKIGNIWGDKILDMLILTIFGLLNIFTKINSIHVHRKQYETIIISLNTVITGGKAICIEFCVSNNERYWKFAERNSVKNYYSITFNKYAATMSNVIYSMQLLKRQAIVLVNKRV